MKKRITSFMLVLLFGTAFSNPLQKGDSLQILYSNIYAYQNPDSLSTRLGPYSYFDNKMVFLEKSTTYENFYKVLTPDGIVAYVKTNLIADSPQYTKEQLFDDISSGNRLRNHYTEKGLIKNNRFTGWPVIIGLLVWSLIIFFIWKYFYYLDRLFIKHNKQYGYPINKPWFLTISALLGFMIGSVFLFKPAEAEWFLNEGFRLWADFPSRWDWLMWGAILLFPVNAIAAIIYSFKRFHRNAAIVYALITFILNVIFFLSTILSGGLIAAIIIIVTVLAALGSGAGQSGNKSSEPSGTITTINGQRMIKTDRGTWEHF